MDPVSVSGSEGQAAKAEGRDEHRNLDSFARALDALKHEVETELGAEDIEHVRRVRFVSRAMEVSGRALVALSLDPFSFSLGVSALATHKTLELMEIGHTVLHGCYDRIEGAGAFRAKSFHWKAPIDEESWCHSHNVRHHQYTNIQGRDPDLDFGGLRLSQRIPFQPLHRLQPATNFLSWFGFASAINLHATGMLDVYLPGSGGRLLPKRDRKNKFVAHRKFLRKAVPYYAREFVLFPLLSGPFFVKTVVGNLFSDVLRDVFAGAVIYCGHVGATDYPAGARAGSRATFYAMQVEGAYNIEVPYLVSILCGGLDYQIEHHLFPRLPPNRLREIAPRVREICVKHGVRYRSDRLPKRVKEVVLILTQLGRRGPQS